MATRYWVGGSGTWDASSTTHWAASSGGASGASAPTSADDVVFDANSHTTNYTVTTSGAATCLSMTAAAPASGNMTLAGGAALNIYGNMTLYAGMVASITGSVNFLATGTGKTITMAGTTFTATNGFAFGGVGGGWTLQDTFNIATGVLNLTNGALDTNGKAVTCGALSIAGAATRSLTLGASAIACASWDASTTTNLTFTCGTSTITVTGTFFYGGGQTYATVIIDAAAHSITGANTFTTLTYRNTAGFYPSFYLSANQTVTGTFTVTGNNASTQRLYVASDTPGTARTITAAVVALTNVDFEDITAAGAASPFTGTSIGNCGGNTNITQTTPVTVYWVHDGTASHPITDARWMTASGGATPSRFPLAQDTAILDASSFGATGKTITIGISDLRIPGLNWTGVTNAPTFSFDAEVVIYGSLTLTSAVTLANGASVVFKGRGSYTLTSAGKTFIGTVYAYAFGGTLTLQDALSATGLALYRGTFSANNFNVTAGTFNSSNTNTRTLTMGTGTWTLTGTGTVWDCSTATNLTLNANTSTIAITNASSSSKTFSGGGKSYYNLTFSGAGTGSFTVVNASNSFGGTVAITNTGGATVDLGGASSTGYKHIDFTGATVVWTLGTNTIDITGSLTLDTGVTFTGSYRLSFSTATTATILSAGRTFPCPLEFYGPGNVTLADDLTSSVDIALYGGTLNLSTFTATCTTFDTSLFVASTRALMGSGYLVLTGTGTVFNSAFSSLLTVSEALTIKITNVAASVKTFSGGGATYGSIWLAGGGLSQSYDFVGSNTFNDFRCEVPYATIRFTAGTTTTVKTFTVYGSSAGHITITSITGATHTLAKSGGGIVSGMYLTIDHSIATPANTFYARNSTDGGNNTGWIFSDSTAPLGLPILRFNGQSVEFDQPVDELPIEYPDVRMVNTAGSGVEETLGERADVIVTVIDAAMADPDKKRRLRSWHSWAKTGKPWSYARHSDDAVLTTLSDVALAGATTLGLTSTAGIIAGAQYVVRDEFHAEVVKVTAVADFSVTLDDPINHDYASGDRFRTEEFWPGRLIDATEPVIIEMPPVLFSFRARFKEDINSLVAS